MSGHDKQGNGRRVVIIGRGIVSSIGNSLDSVTAALKVGRSGIVREPSFVEHGLRSQVCGSIDTDSLPTVEKTYRRHMGLAALYAHHAANQAVEESGLALSVLQHPRVGGIVGQGGTSGEDIHRAATKYERKVAQGKRKSGVLPYLVQRSMSSSTIASLQQTHGIQGLTWGVGSACASSLHAIADAVTHIQAGNLDAAYAGGADEVHWIQAALFDAIPALSVRYNEEPSRASRPFDIDREGFVISGGAGIVLLAELEWARRMGAKIIAEIIGWGATSDGGHDMVQPSGEGGRRAIEMALIAAGRPQKVDYINAHGTSTPIGDKMELTAIQEAFQTLELRIPPINSSKSLAGHGIGATGAQEVIYTTLQMEHGFLHESANIDQLDPAAEDFPIVRQMTEASIDIAICNSFGFGGTNGCISLRRWAA